MRFEQNLITATIFLVKLPLSISLRLGKICHYLIIEAWKNMDENFFMNLCKNVLEIYQISKIQGLKIEDIHENNMGYREGELVAYDFI